MASRGNPLTRWSLGLQRQYRLRTPNDLVYPGLAVGLEGCRSGFNATNALRSTIFFGTSPPTFLGASGWRDIARLETDREDEDGSDTHQEDGACSCVPLACFSPSVLGAVSSQPQLRVPQRRHGNSERPAGQLENASSPEVLIAIENFVERAVSIHRFRFPKVVTGGGDREKAAGESDSPTGGNRSPEHSVGLIVGHENHGVSKDSLNKAKHVVFIPQFGTISSLNVVTSLGIALYYCHLDQLGSRGELMTTMLSGSTGAEELVLKKNKGDERILGEAKGSDEAQIEEYVSAFAKPLPRARKLEEAVAGMVEVQAGSPSSPFASGDVLPGNGNDNGSDVDDVDRDADADKEAEHKEGACCSTNRVDMRPIHPLFYSLESNVIKGKHNELICGPLSQRGSFSLSVLYENKFDQRNLGGLIRLANAFLADVHYVGRRKLNVQGAVGTHLYTHKEHYNTSEEFLQKVAPYMTAAAGTHTLHSLAKKGKQEEETTTPPTVLALLSCEHEFLYFTRQDGEEQEQHHPAPPGVKGDNTSSSSSSDGASSSEDIRAYEEAFGDGSKDVFLDDSDLELRAHFRNFLEEEGKTLLLASSSTSVSGGPFRLMLLIPQEGKAPDAALVKACRWRFRLLRPRAVPGSTGRSDKSTNQSRGGDDHVHDGTRDCSTTGLANHRGIPAQVASGIALERLFSLLIHRG